MNLTHSVDKSVPTMLVAHRAILSAIGELYRLYDFHLQTKLADIFWLESINNETAADTFLF